jgi:hypothetical protein
MLKGDNILHWATSQPDEPPGPQTCVTLPHRQLALGIPLLQPARHLPTSTVVPVAVLVFGRELVIWTMEADRSGEIGRRPF